MPLYKERLSLLNHDMEIILTNKAPAPLGPYAQATKHNGQLYIAMQLAVLPDGTHQKDLSLPDQLAQVLENLKQIMIAGGSNPEHCLQVTLYSTDLSQGAAVNAVYEKVFSGEKKPARSVVEVQALPLGYKIAAEAIAAC